MRVKLEPQTQALRNVFDQEIIFTFYTREGVIVDYIIF
jgi:hypothetical protein